MDHVPGRTLKYIYDSFSSKEEVYDDTDDPKEQHDIMATTDPSKLQELRRAMRVFAPDSGG